MFIISIDYDNCVLCEKCFNYCPKRVFAIEENAIVLSSADHCTGCMSCVKICPTECIEVKEF